MQQVFVKFDDVDQVRNFVNVVNTVEANFELGSGRRIVDPKSILGVFALDLARPQRLVCDSDDSSMLEKISPFLERKWAEKMRTATGLYGKNRGSQKDKKE